MKKKIMCLMDPTVPHESRCFWCCIYCEDKESCECACPHKNNTETEIVHNVDCVNAYEY